ncbi:DNA topoisomerase 2-alpha [Hymenolepis weldensis]
MSEIQSNGNGDIEMSAVPAAPALTAKKRLSVERIYQKKTQLEHILIRPDTYIGTISRTTTTMWVYDKVTNSMIQREITYTPGLYKIYDEILVNAADNKIRDPSMSCIKIDIKPEENLIRIWNNGAGIPVVHHKVENMYVPSLIFGHLLTSSNYDDSEQKVTGGRNGYGAKLCNIFSKKFIVETSSKDHKKCFKQTWVDNMTKTSEPKIKPSIGDDYTCISFYPDLERFGMTELDADTVALFERRAYDVAASTRGVKVFLNGERVPIKNFKDYIDLYLKDKAEDGTNIPVVYEVVNPRWEIAVAPSSVGFQQVSFVNSIATTKGGRHVDYIADQVVTKLIDVVKKKSGKSGVAIKNFQVRSHMWVFINCLIVNPTFDSQTKEFMSLESKNFGSICLLNEKFMAQVSKSGIVESILSWIRYKAQEKMDKQCHKQKHAKLKGIPKLDDANDAGTRNSVNCTLILTEGDSAKTLAVAGLSVVGRDRYGVFPLKGKLLNVREAPTRQIMENTEINNLIKIIGLQYKNKYETQESLSNLRYGKVMIMTDQDQDGSHIKGLLISFIHHNWPNLLRHNFLEQFITPIVKAFKGKQELAFYSIPEFEEWQKTTPNWHTYRVKYYKDILLDAVAQDEHYKTLPCVLLMPYFTTPLGLGTSSSKEAKEYFSDMARHRICFNYTGPEDDSGIMLAFNKNKINERKQWLTSWMEGRRRRQELGLSEDYLYSVGTHAVTYHDFIHKELVLFSNMDNERSIPSLVDGLKPGQRKVLFTCLKRNQVKEIKVAQLTGAVAEMSSYHHGEMSLMGTIINLAQDFVGSNNLNLLLPIGQFGTRLAGGKDSASARYIFTALSPLSRRVFHEHDDAILNYLQDDNQRIEPEWYIPIIPMVLINGAEGIGTGWSTKVPNYDTLDVISNLRRMLDGLDPRPMLPSYRGYHGKIVEVGENRYVFFGEIAVLDDQTVEISELPVKVWTQTYKEQVLELMLNGSEKVPVSIIDYKEYHTDVTVRFVITMTQDKLREAETVGLHKFFKLAVPFTTNSMVLFDKAGCLKRYNSAQEILQEFYTLRLELYDKRKSYLVGMLSAEARRLENQARFVMEKIEGKIIIENRSKKDLVRLLRDQKYDPDPVRAWKECVDKMAAIEDAAAARQQAGESPEEVVEGEETDVSKLAADYNYILGMPLWSLSKERKDDLLAQRDKKRTELKILMEKSNKHLWRADLEELETAIKKYEADRERELENIIEATEKKALKLAAGQSKGRAAATKSAAAVVTKGLRQTRPDPNGRRVEPVIDPEMAKRTEALVWKDAKRKAKTNATVNGGDGDIRAMEDDFLADLGDEDSQFGGAEPPPLFKRLSATLSDNNNAAEILAPLAAAKKREGRTAGAGRGRGRGGTGAGGAGATRKLTQKKLTFSTPTEGADGENSNSAPPKKPGVRGKRASPKKPRKKRNVFDSSESETESDEDFSISKGFDFAPFKDGEGKMISLAERVRTQSSRRTAAEAAKKFVMLDSDSEEQEESEKEVFTVVDHGQGNKELDLTPIKPPPTQKSKQQSEEKVDANAGPSSSLWPISYNESAVSAASKKTSTRGRGRGRGGSGTTRGRVGVASKSTTTTTAAPKRSRLESDTVDDVDDIFRPDDDESDAFSVKQRVAPSRKRKRNLDSDSDEDFVPE